MRSEKGGGMISPAPENIKSAAAVALAMMTLGVQSIDRKFGEGYASDNPELLAAFIQAGTSAYVSMFSTPGASHGCNDR